LVGTARILGLAFTISVLGDGRPRRAATLLARVLVRVRQSVPLAAEFTRAADFALFFLAFAVAAVALITGRPPIRGVPWLLWVAVVAAIDPDRAGARVAGSRKTLGAVLGSVYKVIGLIAEQTVLVRLTLLARIGIARTASALPLATLRLAVVAIHACLAGAIRTARTVTARASGFTGHQQFQARSDLLIRLSGSLAVSLEVSFSFMPFILAQNESLLGPPWGWGALRFAPCSRL
jgi:hypothetical protein